MPTLSQLYRNRPLTRGLWVLVAFVVIFWGLRLTYWRTTYEAPYADILEYVLVAKRIVQDFTFASSDQFYADWTPVTPSVIAVAMILGGDHFQWVFRFLVQGVCFAAVLLLAFEIIKLTGRKWHGATLLFAVALSRPSIFWSLKLGTEAVNEALLIGSIGLVLHALRTRSLPAAAVAGATCLLLALNRPQNFPSVVLVALCLGLSALVPMARAAWRQRNASSLARQHLSAALDRRRAGQAACFVAAAALTWSPWLVRNYLHFGGIVPFSTSGYYVFIWEYGGAPIRAGAYQELTLDNGYVIREFGLHPVRAELEKAPDDLARQSILRKIAAAWFKANLAELPWLMAARLKKFVSQNGANGLTTVPRYPIFTPTPHPNLSIPPEPLLDLFLFDKSPLLWFAAVGAVVLLTLRHGVAGATVLSLWLTPWLFLTLLIGYERTVESMISVTVWLAIYFGSEIVLWLSPADSVSER